jgi:curli production assembly/transport component CsgG/holdfast attachment protein HfaB
MAISAFDRLNLPLVERLDNAVAETELKLANNNLIGDRGEVRKIGAGSLEGSDIFLVGGITELNYNIGSVAQDVFADSVGYGAQAYVMNIAIDLRIVDTDSMRVLEVVSYQKQILGREVRAGVFEFFDGVLFDLSVSDRALEPMQLAVRAMIEKAVGEMARSLFGLSPEVCTPSAAPEAEASITHTGDRT